MDIEEALHTVTEGSWQEPCDIQEAAEVLAREVKRCHGFSIQRVLLLDRGLLGEHSSLLGWQLEEMAHQVRKEFGTFLLPSVRWEVHERPGQYVIRASLYGHEFLSRVGGP